VWFARRVAPPRGHDRAQEVLLVAGKRLLQIAQELLHLRVWIAPHAAAAAAGQRGCCWAQLGQPFPQAGSHHNDTPHLLCAPCVGSLVLWHIQLDGVAVEQLVQGYLARLQQIAGVGAPAPAGSECAGSEGQLLAGAQLHGGKGGCNVFLMPCCAPLAAAGQPLLALTSRKSRLGVKPLLLLLLRCCCASVPLRLLSQSWVCAGRSLNATTRS
jgi:hypothetical protein